MDNRIKRCTAPDTDPRWWALHVPAFECPDPWMEALYDYRWALVSKHIRYASAEIGYIATEFNTMEDTWSGRFGAISCPAELQLNELRWLRDDRVVRDFLRYWLCAPDNRSHLYSWSLGRATEDVCAVLGDWSIAQACIDDLIAHQRGWENGRVAYPNDRGYDSARGLYWNTGRDSSGEFNLASCQLDEALRGIEGYKIRGGAGYRPDINANMYGNLKAIGHILSRCGRKDEASAFFCRAEGLRQRVLAALWEPDRGFFLHRWRYDEYAQDDFPGEKSIRAYSFLWDTNRLREGGTGFQEGAIGYLHGRELSTYWMWHYDMIPEQYDTAWRFLRDPKMFEAPFGPCSGERGDPWFSVVHGECRMNGDSWPLLTSRALTALKDVLQTRDPKTVGRQDFAALMRTYSLTQQKDGKPYCAESHDPFQNRWTVDRQEGRHYFHSSYNDLVISGLMGLRAGEDEILRLFPLFDVSWSYCAVENLRYHGHDLSIYWDRDGSRYGLGPGFHAVVNGEALCTVYAPDAMECALPAHTGHVLETYAPQDYVNVAVNNESTAYPMMSTSCIGNGCQRYMQNGRIWFHSDPVNAWVNLESDRETEWVVTDFGRRCSVAELRYAFLADEVLGTVLPTEVCFSCWQDGEWVPVGSAQTVFFAKTVHRLTLGSALHTTKMRMDIKPRKGFRIGVIEWEIWGTPAKE